MRHNVHPCIDTRFSLLVITGRFGSKRFRFGDIHRSDESLRVPFCTFEEDIGNEDISFIQYIIVRYRDNHAFKIDCIQSKNQLQDSADNVYDALSRCMVLMVVQFVYMGELTKILSNTFVVDFNTLWMMYTIHCHVSCKTHVAMAFIAK